MTWLLWILVALISWNIIETILMTIGKDNIKDIEKKSTFLYYCAVILLLPAILLSEIMTEFGITKKYKESVWKGLLWTFACILLSILAIAAFASAYINA